MIAQAEKIVSDYTSQGYDLTLRQLYYQFVARDLVPNTMQSYKRLGDVVSDARLAGLIDWKAIEDRTRNVKVSSHWNSPGDILHAVAGQYAIDRWKDQAEYIEVWVEKEALMGVVERPCKELDVPRFACRGYVSQSEMWAAEERIREACLCGYRKRRATIIHLGDHDPSGVDMTRDIRDRLNLFAQGGENPDDGSTYQMDFPINIERIALNMDQVEQYSPPPNPAKITDSRAADYIERFGPESWELDALEPSVLDALIRDAILAHLDLAKWEARKEQERIERDLLEQLSGRWHEVQDWLRG
jgi:hypothetical protein